MITASAHTLDGGYILAGYTSSNNGDVTINKGDEDLWIVKTDSMGNLMWQKSFGGENKDEARDVQELSDGGFIIAASTMSTGGDVTGNHGSSDYWILKLDSMGNLLWQKCFGGSGSDVPYAVDKTRDGGYVIAGITQSSNGNLIGNHANGDYWIIKVDGSGNLVWQRAYGGSAYDFAHAVVQSFDKGFIVSGYARSSDGDVLLNHGQEDMWILKLDSSGNIMWQKSYGGTGGEGASSLQTTVDGGYVLTGITHSFNLDVIGNHGAGHDIWVVKIDSLGNIEWKRCLGGSDTEDGHYIRQTKDRGFLVAGKEDSDDGNATNNRGGHDFWVVKLYPSGAIDWQVSYGGSMNDEANTVMENSDSTFVLCGYTASNDFDVIGNHGGSDFWFLKLTPPAFNTFYADSDDDSYGNALVRVSAASAPPGYVTDMSDCNDSDNGIHPHQIDGCNSIDDDCDGVIDDDGLVATITPLTTVTICNTSSLALTASQGPGYLYQWKRSGHDIAGATNAFYNASSSGAFSVTITNGSCVSTSPATMLTVIQPTSTVVPQGITQVCPKTGVSFSVNAYPALMFQWNNSNGIIPGATNAAFTTNVPGQYFVTEMDIMGCTFNSSISTLKSYPAAATSISVYGNGEICNNQPVILKAKVKTDYAYQWYKDNILIPAATSYTFNATVTGTYKYSATTPEGCTAFSTTKTIGNCKINEEITNQSAGLSVYPNPSQGLVTISLNSQDLYSGEANLQVYNSIGQIVKNESVEVANGSMIHQLSFPNETRSGIYFVRLLMGNEEFITRLVISR